MIIESPEKETKEQLKTLFDYDPDLGFLKWRERDLSTFKASKYGKTWNARYSGKKAGCLSVRKTGEILGLVVQLKLGKKKNTLKYVHRLIWIWHNGPIPEGYFIDHIDRNNTNNKIENLRIATPAQNSWNQTGRPSQKKSKLPHGVTIKRVNAIKPFQAQIVKHTKVFWQKTFSNPEEAFEELKKKSIEAFGEFSAYYEKTKIE